MDGVKSGVCGAFVAALVLMAPVVAGAQAVSAGQDTLPVVPVDPVVVSVTRFDVRRSRLPNSVSVVSRERIEESGAASVLSVLHDEVPGLFVTQRGSLGFGVGPGSAGRITIRGVGGNPNTQVLVMTDGRPQMMGLMGHPIPDVHVSSGVERVEVVRGPASVLYGTGALGGVVNIITRRRWAPGLGVEGGVAYGTFDTHRWDASFEYGAGEGSGVSVAGSSYRTDGHRRWSRFALDNASVRGRAELGPGLALLADFSIADIETYDPGAVGAPLVDAWVDVVRGGGGVALEGSGAGSSWSARLYHDFGRHRIHDGFYSQDHTFGLQVHRGVTLEGDLAVTVGADAKVYGGEAENTKTAVAFGSHHVEEVGLFGVLHLPLGSRIFGTGGARLNHHGAYGTEFTPQFGLSILLDGETTLRAHTARGFRSPTIRELYLFPFPTPDLEPERAWSHEVSILRRFGGLAALELSLYRIDGANQIRVGGAAPNLRLENTGRFEHRGGELSLQVAPVSWAELDLSYGYLDVGELTLAHPRHQLNGGGRFRVGGVTGRIGVQHVAGVYGADFAQNRLPDYTLVDARVGVRLADRYALYLSGDNLFDAEYQIIPGYPMPGREFTIGLRARSR